MSKRKRLDRRPRAGSLRLSWPALDAAGATAREQVKEKAWEFAELRPCAPAEWSRWSVELGAVGHRRRRVRRQVRLLDCIC